MINSFAIIFVSIVLEALPFVFLWTIIASAIHVYITPQRMQQMIPRHPVLAYLFAWAMWLVIPICECVSVPLLKQLLKKWMPVGVGVTFMASAPIVNPLVMMSTWFAFSHDPSIFWRRIVGGFCAAILVWWLFGMIYRYTGDRRHLDHSTTDHHDHTCAHHSHATSQIDHGITHFVQEFTTICGYLVVGALLAALAKVFLPVTWIETISSNIIIEIILLQFLAFALSLCSEADAFIARTFQWMFSNSAILSFLLFGPMIDFKNMMMLRMIFSWKHIVLLMSVIMLVTWCVAFLYMYSPF